MMPLKILLSFLCFGALNILSMPSEEMGVFLRDFIYLRKKPASILSYLNYSPTEHAKLCENLARNGIPYLVKNLPVNSNETIRPVDNTIFLLDLEDRRFLDIMNKVQGKTGSLLTPSCWILFYSIKKFTNNITTQAAEEKVKSTIENLIADVYISIDTEVYISILNGGELELYLIYKKRPHLPLIWENHGKWNSKTRLNILNPINSSDSLAMRRRNMERLQVVTTAVYSSKQSLLNSKDFAILSAYMDPLFVFKSSHTYEDGPAKTVYYMSVHLFEWINATGYFNITNTWGYKGSDGKFTGIMKELEDGRSDFSGSILIVSQERMHIVEYVISPGPYDISFIFRKPALASTSNIYVLPFTNAVWVAIIILFVIMSAAFIAASIRKFAVGEGPVVTAYDKVAGSVQDILCCVFQQGTAQDPMTLSGRQILFWGLLAFTFLYTAYAANVVALLQSSDNNINSVESLLNSPLQCGTHNVAYNRIIFSSDTRPAHRALWLKKGLPQGEKFFISVDEGIRRMKTEMFAFNVEAIAGVYTIQKTFQEHEKCNIGTVKFVDFKYPYFAVAKHSHIKEVLRIGAIRIKESGVQERSNRRISARVPSCSSGTGMFTAVDLMDVAPAFQCLLSLYTLALMFFGIELLLHRHQRVRFASGDADVIPKGSRLNLKF